MIKRPGFRVSKRHQQAGFHHFRGASTSKCDWCSPISPPQAWKVCQPNLSNVYSFTLVSHIYMQALDAWEGGKSACTSSVTLGHLLKKGLGLCRNTTDSSTLIFRTSLRDLTQGKGTNTIKEIKRLEVVKLYGTRGRSFNCHHWHHQARKLLKSSGKRKDLIVEKIISIIIHWTLFILWLLSSSKKIIRIVDNSLDLIIHFVVITNGRR